MVPFDNILIGGTQQDLKHHLSDFTVIENQFKVKCRSYEVKCD